MRPYRASGGKFHPGARPGPASMRIAGSHQQRGDVLASFTSLMMALRL
jgi:hypothetical protein